ncbi:MAG: hypothetical protein IT364_22820 [Candidatus Hydrogenedentes bacterium]|nr:hypothetical protein [Candidatus Hydrogenedentota bacterium]
MNTAIQYVMLFALTSFVCDPASSQNLLPNGDVEDEFVNLLRREASHATHVEARNSRVPAYWQTSDGVTLCREEKHAGGAALQLEAGENPATASIQCDYWRVKDPAMPFGTPLVPGREVRVSFFYKTASAQPEDALTAAITLGTITGLTTETHEVALAPSAEWKEYQATFTPSELLWGAKVAFTLTGGAQEPRRAWIDGVQLTQELSDAINLVHNGSFEDSAPQSAWPAAWEAPIEDEWVSWVGARFRAPQRVVDASRSGAHSIRANVVYADVSGISQEVRLEQDAAKPVLVSLWSRLENSVGNRPPGYFGSDNLPNLTLYVYHTDGTMQEVSPTFSLGESDHGWEYLRGGFLPRKPVEKVRVQVTLLGSEGTTSLWIDDVSLYELSDAAPLSSERYAPPRTLFAEWGTLPDGQRGVHAANDWNNVYVAIPRVSGKPETLVYLNAHSSDGFMDYRRLLYAVVRIDENGHASFAKVAEKQGYTANGMYGEAEGLSIQSSTGVHKLTIPFRLLNLEGPPLPPLGFNIEWRSDGERMLWTGKAINRQYLGRLVAAVPRGLEIQSLRLGNRWDLEPDQSQDFVTHPPIYAGMNSGELTLISHDKPVHVNITAGVTGMEPFQGTCDLAAGEPQTVSFTYDVGRKAGVTEFSVSLRADGAEPVEVVLPLEIPPSIELVLDQEFYFPEEAEARVEVHNRLRPIPPAGSMRVIVKDEITGTAVAEFSWELSEPVSAFTFPLESLRVNPLPVQDYTLAVTYVSENGSPIASRTDRFGRLERAERRPLPPISKVSVDDAGRLVINDDFRFFPVVPSLSSDDWREALELGANVQRAYYIKNKSTGVERQDIFADTNEAWNLGAYTLTIGPGPESVDAFEEDRDALLSHPGFLGCYAKQFYYWGSTPESVEYRTKVENLMATAPASRLLVWGHHDSSFLYDLGRTDWPAPGQPVGYCYTKIMGRPGPAWRNAPFLTETEEVLDRSRFKLGEVNYYVSWHDDEIVPEHFKTYCSIRGDDWRGVRCESYQAIIAGANGLYHYLTVQKGGLQRLRGWFHELNYLWPAFVQDDAANRVTVTPADSAIAVRLKQWNGKLYLLSANSVSETQRASIIIGGIEGMRVQKLFNLPGAMVVEGNTISDTWNENDAFVYEIDPNTR